MIITIKGNRLRHVDKKLIHDALEWLVCSLVGTRLAHYICIDVVLDKTLSKETGCLALCGPSDYDYGSRHRDFEIILDPTLTRNTMLCTLAHESVHVKQYARGEIRDNSSHSRMKAGVRKWLGKNYKIKDDGSEPWEREAYRKERALTKEYKKALKTNG